ncbi:MAG: hypothetical protein K2P44_13525 [Lachnospiraceae bacterium]|nr:hypothetical protein [Lachnospiraceae bacterium]
MGVSAKGRRKIQYRDRTFVWWVAPDSDDCDRIYLNIVSEDKSIVLAYRVGDGSFYAMSKGRYFQGRKTSGRCERYRIPFESPLIFVTPRDVAHMIAWAVDGEAENLARIAVNKP